MRVLICEDQVLLRDGLARLFADAGHEVVATLGDAEHLVVTVAEHRPDLAVLDIRLPPTHTDEGVRGAVAIKSEHPDIGVLLLSQHVETTHSLALVALPGFGYLLKDRVLDITDFLATAERVAAGGSALDREVVARLMRADDGMTEREREVLKLMAEGLTNVGIARRLVLSERTVETHVRHVLIKLDLPESEDGHRRVLAVLAHLRAQR